MLVTFLCTIRFAQLTPASWKLEQKLSKNFASLAWNIGESTISQKPNDIQLQKALSQLESITHIDLHTYASLLTVCASSNTILQGRYLHRHIMVHGNGAHTALGFLILEMYGKCGAVEDAVAWFEEMPSKDASTWNYMMSLYMRHGLSLEALHLLDQMLQQAMVPDMITYISFLSVCTELTLLVEGKRLHTCLSNTAYQVHVVLMTALVNFYGKCGDPNHALQLFDAMPQRGTITWNALMSGYKKNKQCKEVLQIFDQMLIENVFPSRATFACTLSACAAERLGFQGKCMHVYLKQVGYEFDFVLSNALVRMYSQSSSLDEAQGLFDVLSTRSIVAAKAMVAAYIHHGCLKDAIKLLSKMQGEGAVIEMVSYIQLLEMCGNQGMKALAEGKEVHSLIKRSGYERNLIVGNSLISMYGKCHSLEDVLLIFDQMPEKDVVTWNAYIAAHSQNKHGKEALKHLHHMHQYGILPDEVTIICVVDSYTSQADLLDTHWLQVLLQHSGFYSDVAVGTALVNAHAKGGDLSGALNLFDLILEPNIISWTTMISSYSLHGYDLEAIQLFKQMLQQGTLADAVTIFTTMNASTSLGSIKEGKIVHVYSKFSLSDMEPTIINTLINMYGKCGYMSDALYVFNKAFTRNLETWNIMIGIHAQHGNVIEANYLLCHMQRAGLVSDKFTSVTYLSACSRAGLVEEAVGFMHTMHPDNCDALPTVEHFDCIVDVLGRASQLVRVQMVIDTMPLQPSGLSWMTIFTVCRGLLGVEQGEFLATHALELDPMLLGFS